MNVELVFVNPRARSTVPARLEAAFNLPEQAKSLAKVQIKAALILVSRCLCKCPGWQRHQQK
jgi:hypothetical protein